MDPVTHGITGALLGKAFFSERGERTAGRTAVFAATVGALFPDVDIGWEVLSRDPLAIVKYHRGFTHSFLALPVFAIILALITRWYARRRGIDAPPAASLVLIYAVGLASHILLDATTSFGTRLWDPASIERVAWDILFIIDFSLTALLLLPQVAAWVYCEPARTARRAWTTWGVFTLCAAAVWAVERAANFHYSIWLVGVTSLLLAALFFLPLRRGRGFHVSRASWCRAGIYAVLLYVLTCGLAHHAAFRRVQAFAEANGVVTERMGAMPMPPSLLSWEGLIRTPKGVYASQFNLRDASPPNFRFVADSTPNRYTGEAFQLSDVKVYWWFARFPVVRSEEIHGHHIVEFSDLRFHMRRNQTPFPFTLQVVFDGNGNLLGEEWARQGGYFSRERAGWSEEGSDSQ